ncbi:MAG: hypothetical protein M1147_08400 [Nitrospirae bacterium]|nr:hypothetical protein [Nitrospirota bacterium]MCL5978120.1 hypothetical protein [Nitrospirota bacterium]
MIITIDALYFMLLIEFALIMLLLTVYFFSKNRKHAMLYRKTMKELADAKNTAEGQTGGEPAPLPETAAAKQPEEASGEPQPVETAEAAGESSLAVKVNKMHRIIDSQKGKILDLMCYKDIFDGAQTKLSSIQGGYNNLKSRLVTMFGESPENKGIAEMIESFEGNNKELESYVEILSKENENLNEKFRAWEDELKKIWEEAGDVEGVSAGMDEGKYGELMQEREKLRQTLTEFESKLQEKSKMFDDMQKQYEDMEKEYMILYKQQQQQQQQE